MGDGQWHRFDFVLFEHELRINVLRDGLGVTGSEVSEADIDGDLVVTLNRGESLNDGGGAKILLDDIWFCSRQPEQEPDATSDKDSTDNGGEGSGD